LITRPPLLSTLFPYTTLFRSTNFYQFTTSCALRRSKLHSTEPRVAVFEKSYICGKHGRARFPRSSTTRRWFEYVLQVQSRTDGTDRKSTRLNSSHVSISYAVF